ncbi:MULTISPECIES: RluA family pseudouridine synthase [Halomonadaceae]|jgi:23S rRNA pseudouridine955/2504/2580 synthase|uniref:Pseudouridine synthase n=2 Tax=Bacteria TaxID=2 RepID=A0A9X5B523_9GAMM|nr:MULTISPECIES: RluA family pseudouridine synthase [Halomonas]MYL26935.1 RluA family pseudouridine synthase [Halomonas utahensis]MYL74196.1 RluA family pseudouridine synthase [Halomonas sp. 22501_18_FS]
MPGHPGSHDSAESRPRVQWLEVAPEWAGQRLDNFLMGRFRGVPKSVIYRVIRKGAVRANRKRVKPDYRIAAGDSIRVPPLHEPEQKPDRAQPGRRVQRRMQAAVLHEAPDFLVVNKPAGIAVHGGSGVDFGLIETLRAGRDDRYLELVHRLDRDTSGLILVARRRSALKALQDQFRQKSTHKVYRVLVVGEWPQAVNRVEAPLQRVTGGTGERLVRVSADQGKAARTDFRVLERFSGYTLLEATPLTGRTHQIRVHAACQGCPVAGDAKYLDGASQAAWQRGGGDRLMLHAQQLTFETPAGERVTFEAPVPDDFEAQIQRLGKRQ